MHKKDKKASFLSKKNYIRTDHFWIEVEKLAATQT